jgi:hypothetical protein
MSNNAKETAFVSFDRLCVATNAFEGATAMPAQPAREST